MNVAENCGEKTSLGYICVVCRNANDGKFGFLMGTESEAGNHHCAAYNLIIIE